jgi:outer membrane protein assembly factor BamB
VHFSSPAYADGSVYVGVAGRYNTTSQITFDPPYGVIALDAATGNEEWFFETSGSISASPAVTESYLVVPSKDGNVYAVERSDGSEVWRSAVGAGVSSASVWAGTAFVGGGSFSSAGRVVALNLSTGSERWSFGPNGPVQASVTYSDGKIFFATNTAQGTVYAVSATTGELAWAIAPIPAQYILSSPVVANGIVFAASDNGHVYAIGEEEPLPPVVGGVPPVPLVGVASVSVVAVAVVVAVLVVRRSRRAP